MINRGCEACFDFQKGFALNTEHIQTISNIINERDNQYTYY